MKLKNRRPVVESEGYDPKLASVGLGSFSFAIRPNQHQKCWQNAGCIQVLDRVEVNSQTTSNQQKRGVGLLGQQVIPSYIFSIEQKRYKVTGLLVSKNKSHTVNNLTDHQQKKLKNLLVVVLSNLRLLCNPSVPTTITST